MSRLTTEAIEQLITYCDRTCEAATRGLNAGKYNEYDSFRECLNELLKYRFLKEAGRLIELPCKVGDTVYKLWYKPCHKGEDYPDSYFCCGCEDECTLERAIFEFNVPSVDWILAHMREFGDLVWFLTKAEAEAKLAELKEGDNQ